MDDLDEFWNNVDNNWSLASDIDFDIDRFNEFETELGNYIGLQPKEQKITEKVISEPLTSVNDCQHVSGNNELEKAKDILKEAIAEIQFESSRERKCNEQYNNASDVTKSKSNVYYRKKPCISIVPSSEFEEISNDDHQSFQAKSSPILADTIAFRIANGIDSSGVGSHIGVENEERNSIALQKPNKATEREKSNNVALEKAIVDFGLMNSGASNQLLTTTESNSNVVVKKKRGRKPKAKEVLANNDDVAFVQEPPVKKSRNTSRLENVLKENEILRKIIATLMLSSTESFSSYTSEEIQEIIRGLINK